MSTTKTAEYIERKRKAVLAPLEKNKWWQKPYDPRPLKAGDVIKTRGRDFITLYLGAYLRREARDAIFEDLGIGDSSLLGVFSLSAQPGFICRINEDDTITFESDVYIKSSSFYSVNDLHDRTEPMCVSAEKMNEHFSKMYKESIRRTDHEIIERIDPVLEGKSNYEAFSELLEQLDEPGLPEIYPELVTSFKLREVTNADADHIRIFAPYLEWSRKHGGDGIEPFAPSADNDLITTLGNYADKFTETGLDPETNTIAWDSKNIVWQRGDFSIIKLETADDFIRQGELLDQCIKDVKEQPYYAMSEKGHWQIYSLLNKTARPVASICAVNTEQRVAIIENRGNSNTSLSLGAPREGRSGKYAQIIDIWLEEMKEIDGRQVNRQSENTAYAPEHPEYGLNAFGYEEFSDGYLEEGTFHWESEVNDPPLDGRQAIYTIEDLDSLDEYINALIHDPQYFKDSEPQPDYDYKVNRYDEASTIELSITGIMDLFDEIIAFAPDERNIDEVVELIAAVHVAMQHEEVLTNRINYEDFKQEILARLEDHAASLVDDKETKYDDYSRFMPVGKQLELGFEEADSREWAQTIAQITKRVFEMKRIDRGKLPGYYDITSLYSFVSYFTKVKEKEKEFRNQRLEKPSLTDLSEKRTAAEKTSAELTLDLDGI